MMSQKWTQTQERGSTKQLRPRQKGVSFAAEILHKLSVVAREECQLHSKAIDE